MATSFYELSVPTFLHTVRAVAAFLDRATKHCAETGADPDRFVRARLYDDMAPLRVAPYVFRIGAENLNLSWWG